MNFATNLFLIPVIGILAASLSTFLAYFVTWLVRVNHVRRLAEIKPAIRKEILLTLLIVTQSILLVFAKSNLFVCSLQVILAAVITIIERKPIGFVILQLYKVAKMRFKMHQRTIRN